MNVCVLCDVRVESVLRCLCVLMFVRVDVCVVSRACCDIRVEMLHLRRDAASEKDVYVCVCGCVCMYMCTCVYMHISILVYMITFRHMNM